MKILSLNNIFEKSVYTVPARFCLTDIAQATNVPPSLLIFDNNLTREPECGDMLVIQPRGKIIIADLEFLNSLSTQKREEIIEKNRVEFLFCGQILSI